MKFSILQHDLLPVIQSVGRSIGAKANLPVLENIYISAESSRLKLSATNLEIGVMKYVKAEVLDKGEITIPGRTLTEIIAGIGPANLEFESNGEILSITAGKFHASINGISALEFPIIPISEEVGVEFEKSILLSLSRILFAAAVDEGRPQLTGVLTEVDKDEIDFVATDGFRLAHKRVDLQKGSNQFKNLIPKRTLEEVIRMLSEESASVVSIATSKDQNQIVFRIGDTIVSSRLIEGNFPSWEKIIPTKFPTKLICERDLLSRSLKLASVFAKNETNIVVLHIAKSGIKIESSTKEMGQQENEIEAEVTGEELKIAFNTRFLQDAINNCPSDQIQLEFSGTLTAARLKPTTDEGLEFIVMPLRVN